MTSLSVLDVMRPLVLHVATFVFPEERFLLEQNSPALVR